MKYLCILCILLCLSCGKTENFQTSKAEKWILLENAYLFQEKESIDKISKLRASIQRQQFLRNELAMKQEKENFLSIHLLKTISRNMFCLWIISILHKMESFIKISLIFYWKTRSK
ncbi:hypothetical protein FUSNEC_GEN_9830_05290 [Fusobacterium necrophorum subsp. funduliforme]